MKIVAGKFVIVFLIYFLTIKAEKMGLQESPTEPLPVLQTSLGQNTTFVDTRELPLMDLYATLLFAITVLVF